MAGLARRQSEQKYCDRVSLDLFSPDAFSGLCPCYGMLCCPTKEDDVMHQQLQCCESFIASSEAELQLAFFFPSSSWLIKMLEGPAVGATMTGENQLLYPLFFVG